MGLRVGGPEVGKPGFLDLAAELDLRPKLMEVIVEVAGLGWGELGRCGKDGSLKDQYMTRGHKVSLIMTKLRVTPRLEI